ncbi:MAG: glycosyltransferase family 2 protein [Myxococcota bacterium]
MPDLGETSAVIPARDEAGAIGDVVAEAVRVVDRVVVVDDGSTDATASEARRAGAAVVSLHPGRGKGHALRTGVQRAGGDTIVLLDGDGQDDPRDIPALLASIEAGADVVIGTRFATAARSAGVAAIDRAGNRMLTELLNALFGVRLTDTQAGFRALRRPMWETLALRAEGFEIETEVLVRALQRGADVREVAVARHPRVHGQRVLHRLRDGLAILGCMVRLRLQPPPV